MSSEEATAATIFRTAWLFERHEAREREKNAATSRDQRSSFAEPNLLRHSPFGVRFSLKSGTKFQIGE